MKTVCLEMRGSPCRSFRIDAPASARTSVLDDVTCKECLRLVARWRRLVSQSLKTYEATVTFMVTRTMRVRAFCEEDAIVRAERPRGADSLYEVSVEKLEE